MRRLFTWLILALATTLPSLGQNPNSAAYPNTVLTEQQATIQSNEVVTGQMALNGGINASALTITLVNASNLIVPSTLQINNEIILIASKAGNDLTVFSSSLTATGCTNASPIVVTTSTAHALTGRERVTITGVTGNTACNVSANSISVLSTTTFSLTGTSGNGAYAAGGAITVTGRGFDGSTPASHVTGALVDPNIVAHHVNQHTAEIRALETALGASLANVAVLNQSNTFTGQPQIFTSSASTAAARILCAALPSTPVTGDMACDSGDSNVFKSWNGASWVSFGGSFLNDPGGNGIIVRTALNTTINRSLTQPAAGFTIANSDGVSGNPTFALANGLLSLENLASTGFVTATAADTYAQRSFTAPAAGFTITNPAGIAGNPTFVLADDLAAVEALASNGCAARTGASAWAVRTITAGSTKLTVSNGDCVSGNPTIDFDDAVAHTPTAYWNFSGGQIRLPESVIGSLPAAGSNTGKVYVATDGTSASDCTVGSGSTRALCTSNGAAWVALGGGGGGSIAIENNDSTIVATASVIDFSSEFSVTESPAGEANVSLAGGGGGVASNYRKVFASTTSVTISQAEHGFGHSRIIVQCYDGSSPRAWIEPNTITVNDSTFAVIITFSSAQTGECILSAAGGGFGDPAFAGLYISSSTTTGPVTAGSYTKIAATSYLPYTTNSNFDEPVDGRLRYTGARTRHFRVTACVSLTSDTITEARIRIAKGGTAQAESQANFDVLDTTNTYAGCSQWQTSLATNEYVEAFITSDAGTPTFTAAALTLQAELIAATADSDPGPCWSKYTIDESDLTDADTSEDETLFTCTQFCKIRGVVVKHSEAFTGGGLTAFTVSVGDASAPTAYAPAFDVFQATGDTVFDDTDGLASTTMASAGHSVIARFTSTTANVADATAGNVDIWVCSETIQ